MNNKAYKALLYTSLLLSFLFLYPNSAKGHSWYDIECCSKNDCNPIEEHEVYQDSKGTWYLGSVSFEKVKMSRDDKVHVCIQKSTNKGLCIYIIPRS